MTYPRCHLASQFLLCTLRDTDISPATDVCLHVTQYLGRPLSTCPQRPILRLTCCPDPSTPDSLKGLRRHPSASTVCWVCFTTCKAVCQGGNGKKFSSRRQMYKALSVSCADSSPRGRAKVSLWAEDFFGVAYGAFFFYNDEIKGKGCFLWTRYCGRTRSGLFPPALAEAVFPGRVLLVAAGKAAWQMAKAAVDTLGDRIEKGVAVTKYGHVMGPIANVECFEAGHPVPDENSFLGTQKALELVEGLTERDTVLFLLSGGGSALFEKPLVPGPVLRDVTNQLLASGADIVEMNTVRKRLSGVKGGRFAQHCASARVFAVVLSDILGDPLDMIASGPACPDSSTCAQALAIAEKYALKLTPEARALLERETPKALTNVTTRITGSVRELCAGAGEACRTLGYEPVLLTDQLCCQAKEAGSFLASILKTHAGSGKQLAFIAGGETVVLLTGSGKGGRNQELALAAAPGIAGISGAAVFSVGSDGTDGPTDAAGGYVDWQTMDELKAHDLEVFRVLRDNDAYHALEKVGGLVVTGPTGTNVNDVAVGLLRAEC